MMDDNTLGLAIGYQEAEIAELTARAEAAEAEVARLREQVAALRALMAQSVIELSAVRIALCIFPWESITDEVRRLVVQNDSLREQVSALRALMARAVQADLDDDAFALEAAIVRMADALDDNGQDARGG